MKKTLLTIMACATTLVATAQTNGTANRAIEDPDKPFGFCTVSSRTDAASTYNVTGGGCYTYPLPDDFTGSSIVLKSTGMDMKAAIQNAIKQNDVVILDGADGDFIVSSSIGFERGNKTILGINNARICTKWFVTDEIRNALDAAGVPSMSTSGGGGTLPNGTSVGEEAEYNTRKIIIELTGDNSESYRNAGIFSVNKHNIIIRNLKFVGPGSIDVGGSDLVSFSGAKNCWVDHCDFQDGMDGNFDITNASDFNTVSWCTFTYTSRSYMHQNTNLVGSSDSETTGKLNTTFAYNWWGPGCRARMPMARVGKIHMLNNYYSCAGNSTVCINPRKKSEFLIDGNYFASGVKRYYTENDATAVTWTENNYIKEASSLPSSKGSTVTVPYDYTAAPYADVPDAIQQGAGATLAYGDGGSSEQEGIVGSILWAMGASTDALVSGNKFTNYIYTAAFTMGSELSVKGKKSVSGVGEETRIQQDNVNATEATDANAITFSLTTTVGSMFKATELSFTATRFGTDRGKMDVKWIDNNTIVLATGITPNRDNASTPYSTYTYNVANQSTAKDGTSSFVINLYELSFHNDNGDSFKDVGFANITIKGVIADPTGIATAVTIGTPVSTEYYDLNGRRLQQPQHGINIRVDRMADGRTVTKKVVR